MTTPSYMPTEHLRYFAVCVKTSERTRQDTSNYWTKEDAEEHAKTQRGWHNTRAQVEDRLLLMHGQRP